MSNRASKDSPKTMPTPQPVKIQENLPVEAFIDFEKEALDRVYKKYGSDLGAFYRDVKQQLALMKCDD